MAALVIAPRRIVAAPSRQFDFDTALRKCEGERPRIAGPVQAVEEDESTAGRLRIELERRFPGAGMPAAILGGHDLSGLAPV